MVIKLNQSTKCLLVYACFLFAYCIQTSQFFNQSESAKYVILFFYFLGYALGVSKLIVEKVPRKCIFLILFFIFTGLAVFWTAHSVGVIESLQPLNLFFMIICMKGMDFDRLVKFDLITRISCTLVLYLLSVNGLVQNLITRRTDGTIRCAYGYGHANRLGAAIFLICLYLFYLRRGKKKLYDLAYPFFGAWFTYSVTNSRTATIGIIIIFGINLFLFLRNSKMRDVFSKYQSIIIKIAVIGLILLVFGLTIFYQSGNMRMSFLNRLFNSRIELGNIFWNYYDITLFGSQSRIYTWDDVLSNKASVSNVGIDILYLMVLFRYGIVTFATYLYMLFWILKYTLRTDKILTICFGIICAFSCVENQFFSATSNIFMLLFSYRIYEFNRPVQERKSYGGQPYGQFSIK